MKLLVEGQVVRGTRNFYWYIKSIRKPYRPNKDSAMLHRGILRLHLLALVVRAPNLLSLICRGLLFIVAAATAVVAI